MLSCGIDCIILHLAILIEHQIVMDRWTDRQTEGLIIISHNYQINYQSLLNFILLVLQTAGIFGNSARRDSVRLQKDEVKAQHARIIEDLAQRHRREMDTELHIIRRRYMLHEIELERKQLEKVTFSALLY